MFWLEKLFYIFENAQRTNLMNKHKNIIKISEKCRKKIKKIEKKNKIIQF